jgi:hypothetical protein
MLLGLACFFQLAEMYPGSMSNLCTKARITSQAPLALK